MSSTTSSDGRMVGVSTQTEIIEQPLATFTFFGLLPTEIRLEIWKLSFKGRRVLLWGAERRPQVDEKTRSLLYVNREAAQVYKENYTPCFYQRGGIVPVKPLFLNFELDTLCFESGVRSLKRLLRKHPEDMSKVQWVDVIANKKDTEFLNSSGNHIETLATLSSLKCLTVRFEFLGYAYCHTFRRWHEQYLISAAEQLRSCLLQSFPEQNISVRPKLAVIFPSSEEWVEDMYVTTGKDLDYGSYGTISWTGMSPREKRAAMLAENKTLLTKECQACEQSLDHYKHHYPYIEWTPLVNVTHMEADDFDVRWIVRDEPWSPISGQDILTRMMVSRTSHTRQSRRDFWKLETSSYWYGVERHRALLEEGSLSEHEHEAVETVVENLWNAMGPDPGEKVSRLYRKGGRLDFPEHWHTLPFVAQAVNVYNNDKVYPTISRNGLASIICLYLADSPWAGEEESIRRILAISDTIP
ncbi:hypothetical protein ONS96_005320 [Cadophora gregata f. sp. sojae]|nr:hypothetical protein ONS96_005320 [Cadophora gregata f. sp. sojae]